MFKIFCSLILVFLSRPLLAETSKGLPQLDFNTYPSLIFWSIVSLIILYLIIALLITPKIASTLNNREQHIQNDLIKAKSLKTESDQIVNELNEQLEKTKHDSKLLIENTLNESYVVLEQSKVKASKEITTNIDKALFEIENTKKEINKDLYESIFEHSELIITKILGLKLNKSKLTNILKNNVKF